MVFLIKFDFASSKMVLKAQKDFLSSLKSTRKKRRQIQENIQQKELTGIYPKSIVWAHFLFGKKKFSDLKW